jgi:hypothetical protein
MPVTREEIEDVVREMVCVPSYVTRTRMGNSEYPSLQVHWIKDGDGLGYNGRCTIWQDGNNKLCDKHTVGIRQSMPLGSISIILDECSGGAWKYATFEGTGITERDLLWAAAWASLGIEDKHRRSILCGPKSKKK